MSRSAPSPAVRATQLREATLPKAKKLKGEMLTAEKMAALLDISLNTFRKWRKEFPGFAGSDCYTPGERGIGYQFDPVATTEFLIAHFEADAKALVAAAERVRSAIGSEMLDGTPSDMTLDDMRKAIAVRAAMIQQEEREGRLVQREVVENAVDRLVSRMTEAGVHAAREQDPTGQMPPEVAEMFENAVESIMVSMQAAGMECLNELRGGSSIT